jgi:hypothetical protein
LVDVSKVPNPDIRATHFPIWQQAAQLQPLHPGRGSQRD